MKKTIIAIIAVIASVFLYAKEKNPSRGSRAIKSSLTREEKIKLNNERVIKVGGIVKKMEKERHLLSMHKRSLSRILFSNV